MALNARTELAGYQKRIKDLDDKIAKLGWLFAVQRKHLERERQLEILAAHTVEEALAPIELCPSPPENPDTLDSGDGTTTIMLRCGVDINHITYIQELK